MAHHVVELAEAQASHDAPELFCDEEHEVHDVLRLAGEAGAQVLVLRGDAHRAGVLMAVALHEAAQGNERRGGKAELLGAQKACDGHVAAREKLAVSLKHDARTQAVLQKRLLGLGKSQLKR